MTGVVGKADERQSQVLVAGPSEHNASAFAGGVGHGTDAGLGGKLVLRLEALAHVAEFSEDLGGANAACARERHDDLAVGQLGDGVLDVRGQLGDLADEAFENGDQCAGEFAFGVGLASPASLVGAARSRASRSAGERRPQ